MTVAPFDIFACFVLVILAARGAYIGFIGEFFSKAAVLLGVTAGILFYRRLSSPVSEILGSDAFSGIASFLALFLVTYVAVKLVQRLVGALVEGASLGSLDRALGLFLGVFEAFVVIALALIALRWQRFFDARPLYEVSWSYRVLAPLFEAWPATVRGFFAK